jgi:sugar phosphate isomerase/epimerase
LASINSRALPAFSGEIAMKIGLYSDSLPHLPFEAMLDWCAANGLGSVEIGTGNFSPSPHCNPANLLASSAARSDFLGAVARRGLQLSAFNCSGNVLDANLERRSRSQQVFYDTVKLAAALGIQRVVAMSGCPGEGSPTGQFPNWVTTTWQPEFPQLLAWQWIEEVEPFWRDAAHFTQDHGVRIAIEMHPGQVAYNPYTLQRLLQVTGAAVGANLDPSHLFWQGIAPLRVIQALGAAIFHVHLKDCCIDLDEMALNGGLDNRVTGARTWDHCIPGKGHDEQFWSEFVKSLRMSGYDGDLTIEYAGPRHEAEAGIKATVELLTRCTETASSVLS